jgi:hypothetical protein
MAAHATITRRAALIGALTSSAALAVPVAANPESEIVALFGQWEALYRHSVDLTCSDNEMDAFVDQMNVIWQKIVALPARDVRDLAIKLVVHTSHGAFDLSADDNPEGLAIIAEAEALAAGGAA